MQVLAPAKINLSLRVLGRRSDGFHEIETFIAPISLFDELKIEQRSGKKKVAFRCDDPSVPQGEDNIVVRATNLFFEKTRTTSGVSIELKKEFHTGPGWVEEVAMLLPLCWHSTNCSKRICPVKPWRKWPRRSARMFHSSFFNPQRFAKAAASW